MQIHTLWLVYHGQTDKKWLRWGGIGVAAAAVAFMLWHYLMPSKGDAFASGNGRIEAVEIDVSAKIAAGYGTYW